MPNFEDLYFDKMDVERAVRQYYYRSNNRVKIIRNRFCLRRPGGKYYLIINKHNLHFINEIFLLKTAVLNYRFSKTKELYVRISLTEELEDSKNYFQ